MELMTEEKKGFKKTDIGLIPEDWEKVPLDSFTNLITKGTTPTSLGRPYTEVGVNFVKAESITNVGKIDHRKVAHIDSETHDILQRSKLKENDLLFSIAGVLGRVGLVTKTDLPANTNQALSIVRVDEAKGINLNYLFHVLRSKRIRRWIEETNVSAAQANLSLADIGNLPILVPPTLEEQQAIATALSDVDELIRSLDGLIEKKEAIKKGTMQQLLTGKKRLPGFDGEWEERLLPEVFNYIHGKAHEKHIDKNGNFIVVNSKFISTEGSVVKRSFKNFCPAKKGDVLTVLSDLPNGRALAKCFLVQEDNLYAVNQRICILRPKEGDSYFLHYLMNRHWYFLKFDDGVTQTHILNRHIVNCPLFLPKDIKEQKAIGSIIYDMDRELQTLRQKREKMRLVKEGMMQELLTGRTRLV